MTKKLYWDKGHGGTDPGSIGNDLLEKVINHKIVEYGMSYIADNYTGVVQKTSRAGDQSVSLNERTKDANIWGADLLMSIHVNSLNEKSNGFETFIYNTPTEAEVGFQNMLHAEIMEVNRAFGITNDRGKKRGNLHMVRESKMTSCLTENLFISNKNDANRLKQEEYLKAIGEAHARGAAKFLGLQKKVKGVSSVAERELNEKELAIQKEAVRLGITDGKNPLREVNQIYVWSALIPLAQKVEALEKK